MNSQIADDLDEGSDDESEYCECDNCTTSAKDAPSAKGCRPNTEGESR
jgi:hypothetical protein